MYKEIFIGILIFVMCSSFVFAADINLYRVRGYINDDNVDSDDFNERGGEIKVVPGDSLEIDFYIRNENNTYRMQDIYAIFKIYDIDDGDDISEDISEFDLNPGDSEKKSVDLTIPNSADEETYDAYLKISAMINGVEQTTTINYTITIDEDTVNKRDTEFIIDGLNNLTKTFIATNTTISALKTQQDEIFKKLEKQETELRDCPATLKIKQDEINLKNTEIQNTQTQNTNLQNQFHICQQQKSNMIERTACDSIVSEKENQLSNEKSSAQTTGLIIGLVVGVLGMYLYNWSRKKQQTPQIAGLDKRESMNLGERRW